MANQAKYQIGDRFSVMEIEYEIVRVVNGLKTAYIFQHCQLTSLQSVLTETELDAVMKNQKTA